MMNNNQPSHGIRVALAGMQFGAAFVPVYLHHPDVSCIGIIDPDRERLNEIGNKYGIDHRHESLDEVLASSHYDAVHLVTPIPLHAEQSIAVLRSGKHCACTVPMATTLDDLHAIVAAVRESGRKYMMMETAVYTRQFLYARELVESGALGRIQLLRGAHYQDMENWPEYWMGLPPMWYATHAIAPCLALAETRAERVHCFGSGVMRKELQQQYGNPFPVETAIYELEKQSLAMEITRSLFHTARGYTESFCVYGEKMTFEWPQLETDEKPILFTMREQNPRPGQRGTPVTAARVSVPDRQDMLPESIARFTVRGPYDDTNPQESFETGGGHHGAHPHLVHEFVRSIIEDRKPWIDEIKAADWTAAGICAHMSALEGGKVVTIPAF